MIKKLFFMAALLAPSLACDANPSADLSVQIVPASAPAVPAPAQAAGFTTQALNADFTSPAYANTATYMDNCGATAAWRFYLTVNFRNPGGVPCSDSTITTDGGSQVLLVQQDTVGTPLSFLYPAHWVQPGVFFPNEMYIEMTFRTTLQSLVQNGSGPFQSIDWFWESVRGETPPPPSWVEIDFLEIVNTPRSSPNWGGGLLDWQPNPNYGPVTYGTTDLTQYHTLGVLITSDESTNLYKCTFMDGSFVGCINQVQGEARNYVQHNNAVTVWLGFPGTNYTSPVQVYIKSINIWECANYQTTGCPGTMVTHWPFP